MGNNSSEHLGNQQRRHVPGGLGYLWLCSSSDHTEFAEFLPVQHPKESRREPREAGAVIPALTWSPSTSPAGFTKRGNILQQTTFPTVVFNCSCPLDRRFYFYCCLIEAVPKSQPQIAQSSKSKQMKSMQKMLFLFCYYLGCSHIPEHTFPLAGLGKQLLAATCGPGVICFVPK